MQTITPRQLAELQASGRRVELIDVRTPVEFREMHVGFARNLPLDQLNSAAFRASQAANNAEPVYVICQSGRRGQQACEQLLAAGLDNVVNVEGGTMAWKQAGLPLICDRQVISLERQVRIAAGGLVLIGAVLGLLVHPLWIALSAVIGGGLVFSGITNTCGMALLLARLPWNQVHRQEPPASNSASMCSTSA